MGFGTNFVSYNPVFKAGVASRPRLAEYQWGATSVTDVRPGISTPKTSINLREIYRLVERCSSLDKAIMAIGDYAWKDGVEWVPNFSLRCKQCNYQHPRLSRPVDCSKCGNSDPAALMQPDEDEKKNADSHFRRMDRNGHTLATIGKMLSRHGNTADDYYLVLPKNYSLDTKGNILDFEPHRDVIVADPRNFRRVDDFITGMPGGRWFMCLNHRPGRDMDEASGIYRPRTFKPQERPGLCDERDSMGNRCGMRLYDVGYVSLDPTMSQDEPAEYYLMDVEMPDGSVIKEVSNVQKFHPSYDGGRSPIVAIWHIANCLVDMEKYMGTFYKEERMSRKVGFVPTGNFKGFESIVREIQNRNVSQNGHYFPFVPFDPGVSGGARPVQIVDLSNLPAELQYLAVREEFHRRVAMVYDITPPFHGGIEAVGGQSQMNPLQWQVTVLGVNKEQAIFNDHIFPDLLSHYKVKEWSLILREAEEDDEMKRFQVKLLETQVAMQMTTLGFFPTGRDSAGHFIFPDKPMMMGGTNNPMAQGQMGTAQGGPPGSGAPGQQGQQEDMNAAGAS